MAMESDLPRYVMGDFIDILLIEEKIGLSNREPWTL